jgi:predicted nucleotidyltransferase
MDRLNEKNDLDRASTAGFDLTMPRTLGLPNDNGRTPAGEETRGYANVSHPALRWLLRSPVAAVAAHWFFQGMLYMDATERWFKLALDGLLTVLAAIPLRIWFRSDMAWLAAFILAHTLNFLFNGQLWGVLKHYGLVRLSRPVFESHLCQLSRRTRNEPSIRWAGVYGSLARGGWSPTSDLDVRLVRKPGVANALRACVFVLAERSRALLHRFPLDIYVLGDPGQLAAMRGDEWPQTISHRR